LESVSQLFNLRNLHTFTYTQYRFVNYSYAFVYHDACRASTKGSFHQSANYGLSPMYCFRLIIRFRGLSALSNGKKLVLNSGPVEPASRMLYIAKSSWLRFSRHTDLNIRTLDQRIGFQSLSSENIILRLEYHFRVS